jgi:hypothetical protein
MGDRKSGEGTSAIYRSFRSRHERQLLSMRWESRRSHSQRLRRRLRPPPSHRLRRPRLHCHRTIRESLSALHAGRDKARLAVDSFSSCSETKCRDSECSGSSSRERGGNEGRSERCVPSTLDDADFVASDAPTDAVAVFFGLPPFALGVPYLLGAGDTGPASVTIQVEVVDGSTTDVVVVVRRPPSTGSMRRFGDLAGRRQRSGASRLSTGCRRAMVGRPKRRCSVVVSDDVRSYGRRVAEAEERAGPLGDCRTLMSRTRRPAAPLVGRGATPHRSRVPEGARTLHEPRSIPPLGQGPQLQREALRAQ